MSDEVREVWNRTERRQVQLAEQAVLGTMLLDYQCIHDVLEICCGEDFYIERNKELFDTIVELYNLGKPIDIVTIKDQMTLRGSFETVGGLDYILETINIVPITRNVKQYAKQYAQIVSQKEFRSGEKNGGEEVESVKKYQSEHFVFDDEEEKCICAKVEDIMAVIKKNNPTFAEAREALRRCGIELETMRII